MLPFNITMVDHATFFPVLLQSARHTQELFATFKTQKTRPPQPISNIMPCAALVKTLTMQLLQERKPLITMAQSLPSLHAKAKKLWNIHIMCTWIQKFSKDFNFMYPMLALPIYKNSAHLIQCVTKNNHPANIINDRKLQNLLTASRLNIELPSNG